MQWGSKSREVSRIYCARVLSAKCKMLSEGVGVLSAKNALSAGVSRTCPAPVSECPTPESRIRRSVPHYFKEGLYLLNKLEFKYPLNALYILFLVLAVIILVLAYRKKEQILSVLKINAKIRFKITRIILYAAALALIVFSLMGPQIFKGYMEIKSVGLDIYVLIDTSKSMLVEDIGPDRISRAKNIIGEILNNLEGDRIGFIPFSSGAYVQMPLTDDYQMARMFLDVIDTDMISGGGTNIKAAINLANNSFEQASGSDKVIIILSDGEEHDSGSLEILKNIKNDRLKVYTIGIGTEKGGLIPVYDSKGEKRVDYKKDENGNYITSRLNSDILKKLA